PRGPAELGFRGQRDARLFEGRAPDRGGAVAGGPGTAGGPARSVVGKNAVPTSGDFDGADDRTLRLAAPEVTVERLDRYLAFQRALFAVPLSADPQVVAAAHAEAVRTSGMSAREVGEIDRVARDFSGRLAVVQRVRERMEAAGGERRAQLEAELAGRDDDGALERRYGRAALEALKA